MERIGGVAYPLQLPDELSTVYNVFHVSQLRKCIPDPNYMIELELVQVWQDLTYEK